MMAHHLIDKVSVLPHGLFLNPERHEKKEDGKKNIYLCWGQNDL